MAELMAITNEYATTNAGMSQPIQLDEASRVVTDEPATRKTRAETQDGGRTIRRDPDASSKRKAYTDDRNESRVVATTEGRQAGGFDSRRLRTGSDMRWTRARNNYESLLDRP